MDTPLYSSTPWVMRTSKAHATDDLSLRMTMLAKSFLSCVIIVFEGCCSSSNYNLAASFKYFRKSFKR